MTYAMTRRIAADKKPEKTPEQKALELEKKRAEAKAKGYDLDDEGDTTVAQAVPMA